MENLDNWFGGVDYSRFLLSSRVFMAIKKTVGDEKYSIGSVVRNIVRTIYGARWVLDLERDHFLRCVNV